jgi:hypothetical protein
MMIEFFHVECVFMDNYRMCPGGIQGNVFSWTMTDGVWEEYGLIMIVCVSRRNTVLQVMIKCVQEEYVMAYDTMCPGGIWFGG